ncbi:type II secretion system protein [Clostridium sp. DL1XJH146]
MLLVGRNTKSKKCNKGFSLIELIVVMCIIAILTGFIALSCIGYVNKAKKQVCNINCNKLESMYEIYLQSEKIEHTEESFEEFLEQYKNDICPGKGEIFYVDGEVKCSVHSSDDELEEENIEEDDVPFL